MLGAEYNDKIFIRTCCLGITVSAIPITPLFSGCILTLTQLYVLIRLLRSQIRVLSLVVILPLFLFIFALAYMFESGTLKAGDTSYLTGISILALNLYLLLGGMGERREINPKSWYGRQLTGKARMCLFLLGVTMPIGVAFLGLIPINSNLYALSLVSLLYILFFSDANKGLAQLMGISCLIAGFANFSTLVLISAVFLFIVFAKRILSGATFFSFIMPIVFIIASSLLLSVDSLNISSLENALSKEQHHFVGLQQRSVKAPEFVRDIQQGNTASGRRRIWVNVVQSKVKGYSLRSRSLFNYESFYMSLFARFGVGGIIYGSFFVGVLVLLFTRLLHLKCYNSAYIVALLGSSALTQTYILSLAIALGFIVYRSSRSLIDQCS